MCPEYFFMYLETLLSYTTTTQTQTSENLNPEKLASIQPNVPNYVEV